VKKSILKIHPEDGGGNGPGPDSNPNGPAAWQFWEDPTPIDAQWELPQFPTELLTDWLAGWVDAVAVATQTPPDLAAMLALSILGAGAARKFRVRVREGWTEPLNLFTVIALPPGDRKSAVFARAIEPVQDLEREELERAKPAIAQAASESRVLEAALKRAEEAAAKETDPSKRDAKKEEAGELSRNLASFRVPEPPRFYCDDITAESLAKMLARQEGRMLVASAEGTVFEVCKGRYSEQANFEVYLKGHSGDALRCDRVGRDADLIESPALSVALAVQPDVLRALGGERSMKGRGFLARFLYAVPRSSVGSRRIAPPPVHQSVARCYAEAVRAVWRLEGRQDEYGRPDPYWLHFSEAAGRVMADFEESLEPQLAEGEPLSFLGGWAGKLAGAAARIAGILHLAETAGCGLSWHSEVTVATAERAVQIARDYLLPHAIAAFGMMGRACSEAEEDAKALVRWLECHPEVEEFSRRDLHQSLRNRRRFADPDRLDEPLHVLIEHRYIRLATPAQTWKGPGRPPSASFHVNPRWKRAAADPGPQYPQNPQNEEPKPGEDIEDFENLEPADPEPPKAEGEVEAEQGREDFEV
jgi:Protein of unknown function (DUF3987)